MGIECAGFDLFGAYINFRGETCVSGVFLVIGGSQLLAYWGISQAAHRGNTGNSTRVLGEETRLKPVSSPKIYDMLLVSPKCMTCLHDISFRLHKYCRSNVELTHCC